MTDQREREHAVERLHWRVEHPTLSGDGGEQYIGAAWRVVRSDEQQAFHFFPEQEREAYAACAALNNFLGDALQRADAPPQDQDATRAEIERLRERVALLTPDETFSGTLADKRDALDMATVAAAALDLTDSLLAAQPPGTPEPEREAGFAACQRAVETILIGFIGPRVAESELRTLYLIAAEVRALTATGGSHERRAGEGSGAEATGEALCVSPSPTAPSGSESPTAGQYPGINVHLEAYGAPPEPYCPACQAVREAAALVGFWSGCHESGTCEHCGLPTEPGEDNCIFGNLRDALREPCPARAGAPQNQQPQED